MPTFKRENLIMKDLAVKRRTNPRIKTPSETGTITLSGNRNELTRNRDLVIGFRWRDRKGNFHNPQDMHTRHLFYIVRMIWNHSAPYALRLRPYKSYYFTEFYTPEYMITAIKVLFPELMNRSNRLPFMNMDIELMRDRMEKFLSRRLEKS